MSWDEYKMFEPSSNQRWVAVNNLNGIIERPEELFKYIYQALDAGRLVFGEAWMDALARERADKADAKAVSLAAELDEWRREANLLLERNGELRRKLEVAEAINKLTARASDVR